MYPNTSFSAAATSPVQVSLTSEDEEFDAELLLVEDEFLLFSLQALNDKEKQANRVKIRLVFFIFFSPF